VIEVLGNLRTYNGKITNLIDFRHKCLFGVNEKMRQEIILTKKVDRSYPIVAKNQANLLAIGCHKVFTTRRISLSACHELDVEAGLQQHGDSQQRFSLLVHNQCLISHEDGVALAFSLYSVHWKDHICALGVDSIASDS
jgi:hypothetical protein